MNYDALSPVAEFNNLAGNRKGGGVGDQLRYIAEEYTELLDAVISKDSEEAIIKEAADLIVTATGLLHRMGYNPNEVMEEVNKSNMSKFCDNLDDANKSVDFHKNAGRYEDVHFKVIDGKFVILGKAKGGNGYKILKSVNYVEADLSEVCREKQSAEV